MAVTASPSSYFLELNTTEILSPLSRGNAISESRILPVGKSTLATNLIEEIIIIDRVPPRNAPWGAALPGSGTQPEHCGVPAPHQCNDCGKPFWADSTCRERSCPACYELWGAKEASKASRRVWAGLVQALAKGYETAMVQHCIVSFQYNNEPLAELRERAKGVARLKGSLGEAIIPHPFRNQDDVWIMDGTVHFHLVAIFPTEEWQPAQKGEPFIWKVLRNPHTGEYDGVRTLQECKNLIAYQLSHAGIIPGHHSLTYSGTLAYNKLKMTEPEESPEPRAGLPCPHCGSNNTEPLEYVQVDGRYLAYGIGVKPRDLPPPPPRRRIINRWSL